MHTTISAGREREREYCLNLHMHWNGLSLKRNRTMVTTHTMHLSVDKERNPNKSIELIYSTAREWKYAQTHIISSACDSVVCVTRITLKCKRFLFALKCLLMRRVSFKLAMPIWMRTDSGGCIKFEWHSFGEIFTSEIYFILFRSRNAPISGSMLKIAF